MEHCESCGSDLPIAAQFCGSCGRVINISDDGPTRMRDYSSATMCPDNSPTVISAVSQPISGSEDQTFIVGQTPPNWGMPEYTPLANDEDDEEEQRRRAMLLGLPLLGALGQPSARNVPMVEGSPQVAHVPMVLGSPATPPAASATPNFQAAIPSAPRSPAASLAPNTPLPDVGTWPSAPTSPGTPAPSPSPSPAPGPSPTPSPSPMPTPSTPSSGSGCALTALILGIIFLIIIGGLGTVFIGLSPALSGSSTVAPGGVLHVHGSHFFPGSSITLTLDSHVPLFAVGGRGPMYRAQAAGAAQKSSGTALQMNVAQQLGILASTASPISASGGGTFDVTVPVMDSWGVGQHTIRATEALSSRSAVLNFTVGLKAAVLQAKTTSLDFGKLEAGNKAVLSAVLGNSGGHQLSWTASNGGVTWLSLQPGNGMIQPGDLQQFMYVAADTNHLKVGQYSATLHIASNGGDAQVSVKLEVVPASSKPAPKLNVTPNSLDFGTLSVGNQATQMVSVSNIGAVALNWKADIGSANWLTLDTHAQTISAGGLPQTINVTADTTNLAAGNYSATLTITSNGGNAQVTITLVVNASTTNPCTLQAPSTTSETFNTTTGSNPDTQSFTIGVSGTCTSGVTITPTVTLASGSGWLAVTPSSATITSGSATFTVHVTSTKLSAGSYTGSISLAAGSINGSPQTVSVLLNVTEVPPVLSVSPASLTFDLSNGDQATAKAITIANTGGASLDWTASLPDNAPTFVSLSAGSGTNLAGATNIAVNVNVNPNGVTANTYSTSLIVSATDSGTGKAVPNSPITVSITITITAQPAMQLSSTSLPFTPDSCQYTASQTITLTNVGGGTLSWDVGAPAYASSTSWLTVSPSGQGSGDAMLKFSVDGSQLVSGQTYMATVTITPSAGSPQTVSVSFTIPSCIT